MPASNGALGDLGTPLASVPMDIDMETRSLTTPDMGADEFTACSSTVTSSTNSGTGSLRAALACAAPGATITIDPSITMITLSDTILINKNVTIKGVTGSPSMLNFDLSAQNLGIRVNPSITATFEDLKINQTAGPVTKPVLLNAGNLTLKNSSAVNPTVPPLVSNTGSGVITNDGLVEIKAVSGM